MDSILMITERLCSEFGLDASEAMETVGEYLSNLSNLLSSADASLASGDFKVIASQGHTIKGLAGNVGSLAVASLGKQLESDAKLDDKDACRATLAAIKLQFSALKDSFDERR